MHNPWLLLVLMCLAVYRVTRFFTRDQLPLVAKPREALLLFLYPAYAEAGDEVKIKHRAHGGEYGRTLAYLISCDWCQSVWWSTALTWILYESTNWFEGVWMAVLFGIAAATFTGWVA